MKQSWHLELVLPATSAYFYILNYSAQTVTFPLIKHMQTLNVTA